MKILLAICFLVPFIYFGYLMSMLDKYLANNALSIANSEQSASAIVLGRTEFAEETIKVLEDKGLQVIQINDPFQLSQERKLNYLFALSESDADNIAFYKIGKKLYCIENMISICNDIKNENMFISERVNYLLKDNVSIEKLLQVVKQQNEVKL